MFCRIRSIALFSKTISKLFFSADGFLINIRQVLSLPAPTFVSNNKDYG
jgi:hypothetical protein